MAIDNVARPDAAGFIRLGIEPQSIEAVLPSVLNGCCIVKIEKTWWATACVECNRSQLLIGRNNLEVRP
jgi:hypothetical protein